MAYRAPYNTTFDEWSGPDAIPPLTLLRSGLPCRLVAQTLITPEGPELSLREAWVTMDEPPAGPAFTRQLGGFAIYQLDAASYLAIPTGSLAIWRVQLVEFVSSPGEDPYYRAWVTTTLPPP